MEKMEKPKMIKIELEFDDGRIQRMTGEDANKWLEAVSDQAVFCHVHGVPFPQMHWEIYKREQDEQTG